MPRAIEITTFRLSNGLTIDDFIAANADIDPWLRIQPGFVSRHIASGRTARSSTCSSRDRPRRGTAPRTA